jgi:hypothetical protein
VWFRDSPHEKAGVTEAERREIGSAPGLQRHGMPWAIGLGNPALWHIAAIGVCYVYAGQDEVVGQEGDSRYRDRSDDQRWRKLRSNGFSQ